MTVEMPILTAVIARAPLPEINLATWGLIFPITLILASPIISIMAASTTLSKDWVSYQKLHRFTYTLVVGLTTIHALLAFTPLYDWLVIQIIAAPAELIEPGRIGFRIMLPFLWGLAIRRINYDVLIRFGYSRAVTLGAATRLGVDALVLLFFQLAGGTSGIVIATTIITAGVVGEALYSMMRVRPILREHLKPAPPVAEPLTLHILLNFYIPLVLTTMLQILIQPIVTAALSRMPNPIDSLAVWPVVYSMLIVLSSVGITYVEAVVVLLDEPRALDSLYRFTTRLGLGVLGILLLVNATPLAGLLFNQMASLPAPLILLAQQGLWLALPWPMLITIDALFQGALLNSRRTRGISESVTISLTVTTLILVLGIFWGQWPGLYVCLFSMVIGGIIRTGWLWYRARPTLRSIRLQEVV